MTLRLGGDGAITGCTSLENPDLTVSGLTISGSFDAEKVLVASGTAAAPSYTFSGDTDNGLYYAGTNSVGVATAGTSRLVIDSSGNVGIANSSPTTGRLVVGSTSDSSTNINITSSTSGTGLLSFSDTNSGQGGIRYFHSTDHMAFYAADNERMRIDSSGRLLVGTTTPGDAAADNLTLSSSGDTGITIRASETDSSSIYFADGTGGTNVYTGAIIYDHATNHMSIHTNSGAERLRIDSSGKVGIGETSPETLLHVNRSAGSPQLTLERSTSATGKYSLGAFSNSFVIKDEAQNSERMRIDSSGNVGIGTTSPGANLHVVEAGSFSNVIASSNVSDTSLASRFALGNSVGTQRFTINMKGGGGEEAYLGSEGNFPIYFQTHGIERMRIDSSGRLLVGTSSSSTTETLVLQGSSAGSSSAPIQRFKIDATPSSSNTLIGGLSFSNTADNYGGSIVCQSDASWSGTSTPGQLQFSTTASGATVPTERMRITSDGSIFAYNLSGSASAGAALKLISNEIYRDTSSIQFKKDVEDIEEFYATNLLENARPAWFRAKEDENPEHSYYGFIAEELAEVEPRLCVFEDGEPFSVDYAKFTPLLLKLLQMQNAHIKSLETKLETLEASNASLEQRLTDAGL